MVLDQLRYSGGEGSVTEPDGQWIQEPVCVPGPLVGTDLNRVRSTVARLAAGWGLSPQGCHALQAIASELAANIVVHAGGDGKVLFSRRSGAIYCQAVDRGPGMERPFLAGWSAPPSGDPGAARGLWMARMLSASFHIDSSGLGTTITAAVRA